MENAALSYRLETDGAVYDNESIEASVIIDIINDFEFSQHEFIVLAPSLPLENSIYLQAAAEEGSLGSIIVEARFVYADDSFKHYGYQTTDKSEVIRMFLAYWGEQKLPDMLLWDDITSTFD